jgi:hypothetical protein
MAKQSKKGEQQIRPELIGSTVISKNYPSQIILENNPDIILLCQVLNLDVFITETSSPE